jgi:hypothetical protein
MPEKANVPRKMREKAKRPHYASRPSSKRSRAITGALKGEGRLSTSHGALARRTYTRSAFTSTNEG